MSFFLRYQKNNLKRKKEKRKILLALLILFIFLSWYINGAGIFETYFSFIQRNFLKNVSEGHFDKSDHILIFSPHPDDEVLAAGGIIQIAKKENLPVEVVFLTNGDAFQWDVFRETKKIRLKSRDYITLGQERMEEAKKANKALGLNDNEIIFLGYPDKGLMNLFKSNWNLPLTGPYTRVKNSPYQGIFSPSTSYTGESLFKNISKIIDDFKPTLILTPHPRDSHPDHQATTLFAEKAIKDQHLKIKIGYFVPIHAGREYPLPKKLHRNLYLIPPRLARSQKWTSFELSKGEIDTKIKALSEYKTQEDVMKNYLLAFVRKNELVQFKE